MKSFVVNTLALFLVDKLCSFVWINDFVTLVAVGLVLTVLNATVKPLLKFFSFPITFITFGLFSLVINGLILSFAFFLVGDAGTSSFFSTMIASMLISLVNTVLNK